MMLEGKTAVVAGGGSGVGRASCLRFAQEGARVVCADIDVDRAKETVALVESAGAMHPLGRPITAEDCAEAAVYLGSDRAANVTGVLLPLDGGYAAR